MSSSSAASSSGAETTAGVSAQKSAPGLPPSSSPSVNVPSSAPLVRPPAVAPSDDDGLLGGPEYALDLPGGASNSQRQVARVAQPSMLGGIAGSSGIAPVVSALSAAVSASAGRDSTSGAGPLTQQLSGSSSSSSARLEGMKAALRMPVQQLSHSAMLEHLSSALAGAISTSGYPSDPIMAANAAMLSDPMRPLGYGMAGLGLPMGRGAWQGMGAVPQLHDPPSVQGIPPVHASHAAGLASVASTRVPASSSRPAASGTKSARPRNKTPRKRGEVPNPGVNGSLGGATPAAIQAEGGFQCPLCDRVYKSESGLRLHRRTVHEGFKGYPCPHCNKLFTQKSHVKTHVRAVHEGKRDYNCPVCTKLFTRASNRDRHVRTVHRNASIHPCDMCERVFISESDLRDHKKSHHTGGTGLAVALLCPQCHAPFHSRAVLNHHIRTAHGGEATAPGTRGGKFTEVEDSLEQPSEPMPPPPDGGAYSAAMASYASGGQAGSVYAAPGSSYALPSTIGMVPTAAPGGGNPAGMPVYAATAGSTLGAGATFGASH